MKNLIRSTLHFHERIRTHISSKFYRDMKIIECGLEMEKSFQYETTTFYKFKDEGFVFYVGKEEFDGDGVEISVIAPIKFPQIWHLTSFFQKVFLNGEKDWSNILSEEMFM